MSIRYCFIAFIPLFMACSAEHKTVEKAPEPKPMTVTAHPVDITVPTYSAPAQDMQTSSLSTWAAKLNLICNAKTCPPQVGLLMFVSIEKDMIYSSRCTASLIAPDKIITNGHCDQHENKEGYFITQKINGKHRQIKIKDLEFKQFRDDQKNNTDKIDVAIFSLQQSISDKEIKPFDLPQGKTPDFSKMYAYVINEGQDRNTFVIDEKICIPERHEIIFPFDFSENPDIFSVINCEIIPGNSGSPILTSPTSKTVEALVDGFTTRKMKQEDYMRPLFVYENFEEMKATNLRCANISDGQPAVSNCVRADNQEINRRVDDYYQSVMSQLNNRESNYSSQKDFAYEFYSYKIKDEPTAPNERFIVYHIPTCRKQSANPQSIPFRLEDVELVYDAYARIKIKINETKEFQAAVTYVYRNDGFRLKVPWPIIDGEFQSPPASEQLGPEFDYSIPVCN